MSRVDYKAVCLANQSVCKFFCAMSIDEETIDDSP